MFTLNELQSGIFVDELRIKIESVGSSKIVSFSKPVHQHISNVSKLFYVDTPKYWELRDDELSIEQFVLFVNMIIKDLLIHKGLVTL